MKHAVLIGLICLGFGGAPAAPLIIDHTAVELYDDIPAPYIAWIKTQWLSVPGESHSSGYRLGLQLLAPGGLLMTYSCSGGVSAERFRGFVASAAADAGVDAVVLQHLQAGPDHPVALAASEGEYLKGLLITRG